jgi:hypothetical protein
MTDHERTTIDELASRYAAGERCHAGKDGECVHQDCPQERDGEPASSGRHCPLDPPADDPWWGE